MTRHWRSRLTYRVADLTLRRFVASVHLRTPTCVGAIGRSMIVVANHQSVLDVALAVEISTRFRYQFATWAHTEVIRRAPMLRRFGALEAAASPQGVARLMAQTRDLLRRPGRPVMLWIFPEGRLGHRLAPIKPLGGAVAMARACGELPLLACGMDYTVFRGFRPHATVVLTGAIDNGLSMQDLAEALENARLDAADLSRRQLPQRRPAFFLNPAGWRAGCRARDPWFNHQVDHPERVTSYPSVQWTSKLPPANHQPQSVAQNVPTSTVDKPTELRRPDDPYI